MKKAISVRTFSYTHPGLTWNTVWVNDYHLMLVPQMVREKVPDAIIGFFLHVAFPSSEIFRCLSVREHLLKGMLGADLVRIFDSKRMSFNCFICRLVFRLHRMPATLGKLVRTKVASCSCIY